MSTLGVGVVGMGFMGAQHLASYMAAARDGVNVRVVALCDPDPARCVLPDADAGDAPRVFSEPAELFGDPSVELVSVCTYTDSHVSLAIEALSAGKHVVVEKPVALDPASVQRLADAARAHPRQLCMPAMCMRFWPGWDHLAACVIDGRHGAVRSARFHRSGPRPDWADDFYSDPARCGGALVDLHIHDADFVRWCFGPPVALSCSGTPDAPTTRYEFEPPSSGTEDDVRRAFAAAVDASLRVPASVTAPVEVLTEAAWLDDPDAEFQMGFEVEFERVTLRYRLADEPPLSERVAGESAFRPVTTSALTGYDGELRHAVERARALRDGPSSHGNPNLLDAAVNLARMLHLEAQSLTAGGTRRALD